MRILQQRFAVSDWSEPVPVSLLRAPAAVAAGAFVVGVAAGAVAGPFASLPPSPVTYLLTLLVCLPFMLPTALYTRHRVLWIWMLAAAVFATLRAVFMAGFLLPYQPVGAWLLKVSMDLLAACALWLAVAAVKRCLIADR